MRYLALFCVSSLVLACGQFKDIADDIADKVGENLPDEVDEEALGAFIGSVDSALSDVDACETDTTDNGEVVPGDVAGGLLPACATVTTDPDPLTSRDISEFTITWDFDACVGPHGGTKTGQRVVNVVREALDEGGFRRIMTGFRDLKRSHSGIELQVKGALAIDGVEALKSIQVISEGVRDSDSGVVTRTVLMKETRVRADAEGQPLFNATVSMEDARATETYAKVDGVATLQSRVWGGTMTLEESVRGFTAQAVFDAVTRRPASCKCPESGSVTQTLTHGTSGRTLRERVFTFTGCGTATYENSKGASAELVMANCTP